MHSLGRMHPGWSELALKYTPREIVCPQHAKRTLVLASVCRPEEASGIAGPVERRKGLEGGRREWPCDFQAAPYGLDSKGLPSLPIRGQRGTERRYGPGVPLGTWARQKRGAATAAPCLEIKVTVKKNRRDRWFADDELVTILAALPKLQDRRVADAYLLMLASACRPNEAAFVEAEDIIRIGEERVWRLPEHKAKQGREFLFPLTGPIGEIINRRYLEAGGRSSGSTCRRRNTRRSSPTATRSYGS